MRAVQCRINLRPVFLRVMGASASTDPRAAAPVLPLSQAAEAALLNVVPPSAGLRVSDVDIPFGVDGRASIHTLELPTEGAQAPPLVLLPGYGTGAALFNQLLRSFSDRPAMRSRRILATDPLGTGLSSRPSWTADRDVDKAEEWFVSSLESWREKQGIDEMDLLGHSLGGYLAVCYAEQYPNRVRKLVLASPVGVPPEPEGWKEKMASRAWYLRWALSLWERGWTPHGFIRSGPWGHYFLSQYVTRRFPDNDHIDKPAMLAYLYSTWTEGADSGEYAMPAILKPGAWAKRPLCERLGALKVPSVDFIYGQTDWMDHRHAEKVAQAGLGPRMSVKLVQNAGHQLFVDNPGGTAEAIEEAVTAKSCL
mmetsp:Transcript_93499/g.250512  ORF Transcript_93499/g.250512 Transcript_93499/m.250512 type:complete len:366 (+) Transcript_93499:26-1123(+)